MLRRRDGIVEQVCGRFRHQRSVVHDHETLFASDLKWLGGLRERDWDQTPGELVAEDDLRAHGGGHGDQPEPAETAPPADGICAAVPEEFLRSPGTCVVALGKAGRPSGFFGLGVHKLPFVRAAHGRWTVEGSRLIRVVSWVLEGIDVIEDGKLGVVAADWNGLSYFGIGL